MKFILTVLLCSITLLLLAQTKPSRKDATTLATAVHDSTGIAPLYSKAIIMTPDEYEKFLAWIYQSADEKPSVLRQIILNLRGITRDINMGPSLPPVDSTHTSGKIAKKP